MPIMSLNERATGPDDNNHSLKLLGTYCSILNFLLKYIQLCCNTKKKSIIDIYTFVLVFTDSMDIVLL